MCDPVNNFPTCTCNTFTSSLIPCTHIIYTLRIARCNREPNEIWLAKNIHPRWRLCNHPLYQLVCRNEEDTMPELFGDKNNDNNNTYLESFSQIEYPHTEDERYQKAKEIIDEVMKFSLNSKIKFQRLIAFQTKLLNMNKESCQPRSYDPISNPIEVPTIQPNEIIAREPRLQKSNNKRAISDHEVRNKANDFTKRNDSTKKQRNANGSRNDASRYGRTRKGVNRLDL